MDSLPQTVKFDLKELINTISIQVVSTELSKDYLKGKVHWEIENLAIVYRLHVDDMSKISRVKELNQQISEVYDNRRNIMEEYYQIKEEMRKMLVVRENVRKILNDSVEEKRKERIL